MPLPRGERNIEMLTQGWPGEPEDFDLAAFAATFRAGRPELSAPALDRVGRQIEAALDRQERAAGRKLAVRATALRFRRFVPVAAAAAVLLSIGAWVHFRPGSPGADRGGPVKGLPVIHAQPAPPSEGSPAVSKPIVN